MGLIRLIIFIVVVALIYHLVKRWLQSPTPQKKVTHSGDMVRCHHCGTFIPSQDAIHNNEKNYCSREHLEADRDT